MADDLYSVSVPNSPRSSIISTSTTSTLERFTRLIIVCGHATYLGDGINTAENQWILQSFQRSNREWGRRSEHETFIAHIQLAALAAQADRCALVIFSGARTVANDVPTTRSEAEGYGTIFLQMAQANPAMFPREMQFALETHATDSYQNLLFSILRFRQLTGAYPVDVTIITHAFKAPRFLEQHAPAIKWPAHRIRVHGLNPPFSAEELDEVIHGERTRAYNLFAEDPYGVRAPLSEKRRQRNWNVQRANVFLGYGLGPDVGGLLEWTGGVSGWETYPGRLPWQ